MIAHRLTTVKDCDQIVLLEQGRVLAVGSYDELLAGSDSFRDMVKIAG
jgi:ABC-type multidrug transport system fused ATPase/permease subunit